MTSPLKAPKLVVIKMDIAMNDIRRICGSVDSEYAVAKKRLLEARSILYSDTKRAGKLISKARRDVIEESKAAQVYNPYRLIIPQIEDDEVASLNQRYRDRLLNGDFKKARDIAVKISQCDSIKSSGHSMEVSLDSVTDDLLDYVAVNTSNKDLVVKRFAVYIDGTKLAADIVYPFNMHHNSTLHVKFDRKGIRGSKASVVFEYTEDDIVKTLVFDSKIDKE